MTHRHLTLLPREKGRPLTPDPAPVPHDPQAAMMGNGIARTLDDAIAGVKTLQAFTRKGVSIVSRIYTIHEAMARLGRLTWMEPVLPWRQADAARCPTHLLRTR